MDFASLLEFYSKDPRINKIAEALDSPSPRHLQLTGVVGSLRSFIISSIYSNSDLNHVFVCNDKDEAAYLQNDLASLLHPKPVFFFPDSFKKPRHFQAINRNNILLRTESINRFLRQQTKAEILITYPEAILETIVKPESLSDQLIEIKVGQDLDTDRMIDLLVNYGFEHEDFVYEPGQFSVRGGIIDIYSYANELPYRIELFGREVESIRVFNPETQRSERKISAVSIIPNIQSQFKGSEKDALTRVVPDNTVFWFSDINQTRTVLDESWQNAKEISGQVSSEEHEFFNKEFEALFADPKELVDDLTNFRSIEESKRPIWDIEVSVEFKSSPQPAFNKKFEMVRDDLNGHSKELYENFLFTDNPRQTERLHNIFQELESPPRYHSVLKTLSAGFIDHDLKLLCYTDHQIFNRFHKYQIKQGYSKGKALTLKALRDLQPGDYVTHIDHGVGKFSGLEKIEVKGVVQEAVRLIYRDNDLLYVGINSLHKISKYSGKDGRPPKINKIGSETWEKTKAKTKRKIKDIARDLIALYAKRKASKGFAFTPDTYLQTELEASFIYQDTPDQLKSTEAVKKDMESQSPMDRLICGDVGFGKTEIAIRAAFKAVADSKQVAVLVPTTILALQHYKTFKERLDGFPCTVDFVNRFKKPKEKRETFEKVKEGKVDILIGTHAILSKNLEFKDLGLFIIDEEQKFGVAAKEKLRKFKANVDTLTLTATPIPRTLQFSLMGARDLSIINTPPPNRQPIVTELHSFNSDIIRDAINYEVYRGGQVFFIHNRVKDIEEIANMISKLCPDMDVGMAHGQMEGEKLEKVMMDFINRTYDILVCTNIVESGLDIPNANTIIINNAHWFGLSDLHQLRGRVGRSNKKAFCYLFSPPLTSLSDDAKKRLRTIEQFADLGSGFNIAMKDLDIRGAGNILGAEQSGFIAEIGFDMFQKILEEAIQELKHTEFKQLFKDEIELGKEYSRDCTIETDVECLIPSDYVTSSNERLSLYTDLDNLKDEEEIEVFRELLDDRFGPIPKEVDRLFEALRLRWKAKMLGMEKIILKKHKMQCHFVDDKESAFFESVIFSNILQFIQQHPNTCQIKESRNRLILSFVGVQSLEQANSWLEELVKAEEKIEN